MKTSSLERPSGTSSFLPSEGVQELWCVSFIPSETDLFIDDEHFLTIDHYTLVGRMVGREAGPCEKIVPGWMYALTAMLCVGFVPKSDCYLCKYCWYKFKLVGSWSFSLLACGSIFSGSKTGYVGCVIWVRHVMAWAVTDS